MSGLYINQSKSFLVALGSLIGSVLDFECLNGIPWVVGNDFVLLGFTLNSDVSRITEKNYAKAFSKMELISNMWAKRNLTVLGRITIVKSLILPQFNYYLSSLPNPTDNFISKVRSYLFRFIWNN